MTSYPWYAIVSGNTTIEQGDFFNECPVVIPSSKIEPGRLAAKAEVYDVVVLLYRNVIQQYLR